MKKYFCLVALLLSLTSICSGIVTAEAASPWRVGSPTLADGGFYQSFQTSIIHIQKQLKERMTDLARSLKQGDKIAISWLLGLAFVYGVIHAIGPGHGKALIASYLLTQRGSPRRGVVLGALAALLHGFSAILIVLLIYFLALGRLSLTFSSWSGKLQIFAYALISVIGLFLVCSKTVALLRKDKHHQASLSDSQQSWWLFLALGVVPCPGTMIVLLFFLSMQMLWVGIVMAIAMAVGMALTLSSVGLCALLAQASLKRRSESATHPFFVRAHDLLGLIGAVLVLVLGLLMLYGITS